MLSRPLLLISLGVQSISPSKFAAPSAWRNAASSGDKVSGCSLPAANSICGAAIWAVPMPLAIVWVNVTSPSGVFFSSVAAIFPRHTPSPSAILPLPSKGLKRGLAARSSRRADVTAMVPCSGALRPTPKSTVPSVFSIPTLASGKIGRDAAHACREFQPVLPKRQHGLSTDGHSAPAIFVAMSVGAGAKGGQGQLRAGSAEKMSIRPIARVTVPWRARA